MVSGVMLFYRSTFQLGGLNLKEMDNSEMNIAEWRVYFQCHTQQVFFKMDSIFLLADLDHYQ